MEKMKKMNKKGFTIVELVIVIAVIAILAGVMIPTFGGIIKTANESVEMQKVASLYKEAYGLVLVSGGKIVEGERETLNYNDDIEITFVFGEDGDTCTACTSGATGYGYSFADGKWTVIQGGDNCCKDSDDADVKCDRCDRDL